MARSRYDLALSAKVANSTLSAKGTPISSTPSFEHDHDGDGAADLPPDIPGGRVWGNSRTLPRILLHDSLGRDAVLAG